LEDGSGGWSTRKVKGLVQDLIIDSRLSYQLDIEDGVVG
jgi:hypothetical protein